MLVGGGRNTADIWPSDYRIMSTRPIVEVCVADHGHDLTILPAITDIDYPTLSRSHL